jgi:hypothetical protein
MPKRVDGRWAIAALVTAVAWALVSALDRGAIADRCAEDLIAAASRRDTAWLGEHVRSPSLFETITSAHRVELLLVRPESSEWSRIGLAVRDTASATVARAVYVLVGSDERCSFIQDYDGSR